jgi:5'-nucleotidase
MRGFDRVATRVARSAFCAVATVALTACATVGQQSAESPPPPETIQILGLNDIHGNVEPPPPTTYFVAGVQHQEQLGGAARLGAALAQLRQGQPNTITVAAGDLIGGSPLVSAYFLDEPTIMALNRLGLALASVGNHEFDRGTVELRRMQTGGCDRNTRREPCQLDRPFEGARFTYLAANVLDAQGNTLFPGTAMREFGGVRVGFIGMTLKETGILVSPAGTVGYHFTDEAETANALAAKLRAEGADTVVLLIHQGGYVRPSFNTGECPELSGDILPILDRLDPAIRLVISGHTHVAYVCQLPASDGSVRTLTSAGRYGYFATDIRMTVDPGTDRVLAITAANKPIVASAGEQADIAAIVRRYAEATAPVAARVVGRLDGSLEWDGRDTDSPLGNLIADAQLAATRDPDKGGAQISFMNSGGVRAGFRTGADGSVTYGGLFTLQPFGNTLVVLEMTGAQIKAVLEEQFADAVPATIRQSLLIPSAGFAFAYDRSRPAGERIVTMTLAGAPLDPRATYRVTVNNFLASGGDGFSRLAEGRAIYDAGIDLDALEAYISDGVQVPPVGRVTDLTPRN